MSPNGVALTRVTDHPKPDETPSWSPDSKRILFASNRGMSGQEDIYIMNADGTNDVVLVPDIAGADYVGSPRDRATGRRSPTTITTWLARWGPRSGFST